MRTRPVPVTLLVAIFAAFVVTALDSMFLSPGPTLEEDGLTEWVTAFAFLLGTLTAGAAIWTAVTHQARIVAASIGTSALLAFLDEVSFGERTFTFRYDPPVIRGKPIDAVHDLFFVAYELLVEQFSDVALWSLVVALVVAAAGVLWLMRRMIGSLGQRAVGLRYFAGGCLLVLAALIADLDFATADVVYVMEEMIELDAALFFVAGGAAQIVQNRSAAVGTKAPVPSPEAGHPQSEYV